MTGAGHRCPAELPWRVVRTPPDGHPSEGSAVKRSTALRHALPLAVLVAVALVDIVMPPGQVVLGLVVMAPLVAATTLGRRAPLGYGLAAFVIAAVLGIYDAQYSGDALPAQLVRLTAVILGSGAALAACTLR